MQFYGPDYTGCRCPVDTGGLFDCHSNLNSGQCEVGALCRAWRIDLLLGGSSRRS